MREAEEKEKGELEHGDSPARKTREDCKCALSRQTLSAFSTTRRSSKSPFNAKLDPLLFSE